MRKRREATPEQKAAAEKRRKGLRELCRKIADMTPAERAAFASKAPIMTVEGRSLSTHNMCMIIFQRPTATVVGGFRQWIKAGRAVRKGEHGMGIWVPRFAAQPEKGPDGETEGSPDGFIFGTVFDVSQTDEVGAAVEAAASG